MTTEPQVEDPRQWLASLNFPECGECDIARERRFRQNVKPRGPFDSPIVVVGEAPGQKEEDLEAAFVGPAGELLDGMFAEVGIHTRESMYVTNTVKCRPLKNRTPTSEECRVCREKVLKQEIAAFPRKLIIAFGNIGYYGVVPKGSPAGIMKRSGIFEKNEEFDCFVLPCVHTAAVLRNPSHYVLLADVAAKVQQFITDGYQLPPQRSVVYKRVQDLDSFGQLLQELQESDRFVVDIETTGFNWWGDHILCMTFSTSPFSAWYLPMEEDGNWLWHRDDWTFVQEGLRTVFEDASIGKIGHNLKFDLKFLIHHFGWDVRGKLDDPMLIHHLLDENTAHGLKPLSARFTDLGNYARELEEAFNEVKRSKIPVEEKHYGKIPSEILKEYALTDADATFRLYDRFRKELQACGPKLFNFYNKVVTSVMQTLMRMELAGVRVDTERMTALQAEFNTRILKLQEEINSYAEEDINVRSTKQLRELLYGYLNLPVLNDPRLRTPKGGPSTDEATLKALREKTGHPVLDLILQFRHTSKLNSTYVTGLLRELAPDGRLHTSYMQHGTTTGRLSSSRPNLQNIPRESVIKGLFVPTKGWYLISADYGQHEVRVWANYSQDPKLIEALTTGDVHDNIGSILLGKPAGDITTEERVFVKACEFGLMYGKGTRSLASDLKIPQEKAEGFYNLFFSMFPKATSWLHEQEAVVKRTGQVVNTFGRVRRLPEVYSTDDTVAAMAVRQARNSPIQSLASDITNFALFNIDKALGASGLRARLLMQVHDEIVAEAPREEVKDTCSIMREQMLKQPRSVTVPLKVDLGVVDHWGGEYLDLEQF